MAEPISPSIMIVRRVRVDRVCTPQQALDAAGRLQDADSAVVKTMPRGEGEDVFLAYFRPDPSAYDGDGLMSDEALAQQFEMKGIVPDPVAQAADNAANPSFADDHPNATHWQNARGEWCYAAFYRGGRGREVIVCRRDYDWRDDWWFAGRSRALSPGA